MLFLEHLGGPVSSLDILGHDNLKFIGVVFSWIFDSIDIFINVFGPLDEHVNVSVKISDRLCLFDDWSGRGALLFLFRLLFSLVTLVDVVFS